VDQVTHDAAQDHCDNDADEHISESVHLFAPFPSLRNAYGIEM
jgi:hypothetical protein